MKSSENPKLKLIERKVTRLFNSLEKGDISSSPYDTGWVARIPSQKYPKRPMFPKCLDWIKKNQLKDGSWGTKNIEYFHDRIISTISCMIALKEWNSSPSRIIKGENYIKNNIHKLYKDNFETIGFELIFPSLLKKANSLNLNLPYKSEIVRKYIKMGSQKLSQFPLDSFYSKRSTIGHSLEFLETEQIDSKKLLIHQLPNGSIGNSTAATSFFVLSFPNNKAALGYLRKLSKRFRGGLPSIYPFEIFEKAWILDNLELAGFSRSYLMKNTLKYLYDSWNKKNGVSISRSFPFTDLDDSAVVFKLLKRNQYHVSHNAFDFFKKGSGYVCYPFQLNPSISAYVHFLGAINSEKTPKKKIVNHILSFLSSNQTDKGYWIDKWHASPYYTTCHLIMELSFANNISLLKKSVNWLISTQRKNGSWGYFNKYTLEETSYALQALIICQRYSSLKISGSTHCIVKGINFLLNKISFNKNDLVPLWIDKCLYAPYGVIKSTIYSTLLLGLTYGYNTK